MASCSRNQVLRTLSRCATALIAAAAVVTGPSAVDAAPLGSAFTYQGRVTQGGSPVSQTSDLQFSLYDAAAGGSQIGTTQTLTAVTVANGLFTVQLDFGSSPFAGDTRWLEIAVRSPAGSGSYTTLNPRQSLTAAPYALYALNSSGLTLPFSATVNNPAPLLQLNNSGGGSAFSGLSASGNAAVFESTGGRALMAQITNAASNMTSIETRHDGLGMALFASITNPASTFPAIAATSVGIGPTAMFNGAGGNSAGQTAVRATAGGINRIASAVHARGNGAAGPGAPQAAAVTYDTGAINVAGVLRQRPAGSIMVPNNWLPMNSCKTGGHSHNIGWWVDLPPLQNDLIMVGVMNQSDSMILATVETTFPKPMPIDFAYYVQVQNKQPGQCTFRVTRMGALDEDNCPPPSEQNVVHYQIINPTP